MDTHDVYVDETSYTQFKPLICVCTSADLVHSNSPGGIVPSILLRLACIDTGVEILKYLNLVGTKAGNYRAKPNSNFARLYRLTVGENPTVRFYRAQHLAHHFLGHEFHVEYESATSNGKPYLKATSVLPVEPIVTDEWFPTGTIRPEIKRKSRQSDCSDFSEKQQKSCSKTAVATRDKPAKQLGLTPDMDPIQHTASKVKPLSHVDMHYLSDTERSIVYEPKHNEPEEDYIDRIFDETF
jgi:hypothetical protein